MNRRTWSVAVRRFSAFSLIAVLVCASAYAQDADKAKPAAGEKKPARAKPRGRLPAYFAKIVDDEQRAAIYQLQSAFAAKKEALRKQLEAIEAEEDAAIEGVLSPEQKQKLAAIRAEAKAAREKKAADKKAAGDDAAAKKPAAKKAA